MGFPVSVLPLQYSIDQVVQPLLLLFVLRLCCYLIQRLPDEADHLPGTGYLDLIRVFSCIKKPVTFLVNTLQTSVSDDNVLHIRTLAPGLDILADDR